MVLRSKLIPELNSDIQIPHESISLIPFSSIREAVVPSFELAGGVLSSDVTTCVAAVRCGYFI